MNFLKLDSPLMKTLGTLADLMILNMLTLLLCIPVITAGAAFTAMHYVLLKIARNEEGYIIKSFFKSFRQNFLQATILWIMLLAILAVLFVDWRILIMQSGELPEILRLLLIAAAAVIYLVAIYIFPVLSRYQNTIRGTIKTAFSMSTFGILTLRTILSAVLVPLPAVLAWYFGYGMIPVFLVFCFTAPGFLRAKLYSGLFKKFEDYDKTDPETTGAENEMQSDADDERGEAGAVEGEESVSEGVESGGRNRQ